jgi:hypothetical protein
MSRVTIVGADQSEPDMFVPPAYRVVTYVVEQNRYIQRGPTLENQRTPQDAMVALGVAPIEFLHFAECMDHEGRSVWRLSVGGCAAPPAPHPYDTDENIGSCEPRADLIRWDKTQKTWHTDVARVGRYSVRRTQSRGPYAAYLNGKQIDNVGEDTDVDVIKKRVETRIHEARRINRETV